MTYDKSHLLIGGGGRYFQKEGQKEKILLCKGWGSLHEKKIKGGVLATQPDQQKRSQCKNAQTMQKNIKH